MMAKRYMKEQLSVDSAGWLISESGFRVAVCPPHVGVPLAMRLASARRLAHCWNQHDKLVAIVAELLVCVEPTDHPMTRTNQVCKKAETLLKESQK
jgi:hypothetical protein